MLLTARPGALACPLQTTRPRLALSAARSSVRLVVEARSNRSEKEWEREMVPGSRPLGNAQLEFARSSSSSDLMAPRQDNTTPVAEQGVPQQSGPLQALIDKYWGELPSRYKVVVATSLAFVICNMDKVNISVAIIPMAQDFGWSPTISGLVQSSFFWGYLLSQIPGGYVTSKFGGRKILPGGVSLWSAATAAVPLLAGTIPGLFLSRAAVGLGEGVAPSGATDMVARLVPNEERSRAMSFIFGGLHVGSLLGLLVAPTLIENLGWQSVFYLFGGLGLAWVAWFERVQRDILQQDPAASEMLTSTAASKAAGPVPWRAFMRHRPVQALAYTHFCNNWFHYTMLAWLPSYFTDTLSLNLSQAAQLSLLPPVAAIVASGVVGSAADSLISRGWQVAHVRKLSQCTAFLGPALCLTAASFTEDSTTVVGLITAALGLASFSLGGLYCNHADISPRYAPVLLGLTNTTGAIPGIVGVAVTGAILDQTGSWPLALFLPSIFFFLTGSAVYTAFGSSVQHDFVENEPFAIEAHMPKLPKAPQLSEQVKGRLVSFVRAASMLHIRLTKGMDKDKKQ